MFAVPAADCPGGLGELAFPLVSDLKREISEAYGVLTGMYESITLQHTLQSNDWNGAELAQAAARLARMVCSIGRSMGCPSSILSSSGNLDLDVLTEPCNVRDEKVVQPLLVISSALTLDWRRSCQPCG